MSWSKASRASKASQMDKLLTGLAKRSAGLSDERTLPRRIRPEVMWQ